MLTKNTAMFDVRPTESVEEVEVLVDLFSTDEAPSRRPQTPLFAVDLTDAAIDAAREFPELPQLTQGATPAD
jgi:hypothetical protein